MDKGGFFAAIGAFFRMIMWVGAKAFFTKVSADFPPDKP